MENYSNSSLKWLQSLRYALLYNVQIPQKCTTIYLFIYAYESDTQSIKKEHKVEKNVKQNFINDEDCECIVCVYSVYICVGCFPLIYMECIVSIYCSMLTWEKSGKRQRQQQQKENNETEKNTAEYNNRNHRIFPLAFIFSSIFVVVAHKKPIVCQRSSK